MDPLLTNRLDFMKIVCHVNVLTEFPRIET